MITAGAAIAALEPSKRRSYSVIWPACQAEPSCNRPPHRMGKAEPAASPLFTMLSRHSCAHKSRSTPRGG
jgi:hypothetical protein